MCFDQKSSFFFSAVGLYLAYYVHSRTSNTRLAIGIFWFFLMEFLQGFQFFFIDDCSNWWNQALTLLGFIHICYQPYFTHIINSALTKNPKFLHQYDIVLRLCLFGGSLLLLRYVLAEFVPGYAPSQPITSAYTEWKASQGQAVAVATNAQKTTEWLRSDVGQLCTFRGKYHLAWSVPMADVSYWIPSAAIHSFLMFAPFFVMKSNMIIQGFFLWLAGPYLASWITPNLMEQASIWCFFSITQIGIMLFLIRETLILNWGRDTKKSSQGTSIHNTHNVADNNKKTA